MWAHFPFTVEASTSMKSTPKKTPKKASRKAPKMRTPKKTPKKTPKSKEVRREYSPWRKAGLCIQCILKSIYPPHKDYKRIVYVSIVY